MKKWFSITLGIVTATGGFLDAGSISTAGEAGAKFGLGLVWALLLATIAVMLLVFVMAWRAPFDWIENAPALLGLTILAFVAAVFALGGPSRGLLPTLW